MEAKLTHGVRNQEVVVSGKVGTDWRKGRGNFLESGYILYLTLDGHFMIICNSQALSN